MACFLCCFRDWMKNLFLFFAIYFFLENSVLFLNVVLPTTSDLINWSEEIPLCFISAIFSEDNFWTEEESLALEKCLSFFKGDFNWIFNFDYLISLFGLFVFVFSSLLFCCSSSSSTIVKRKKGFSFNL